MKWLHHLAEADNLDSILKRGLMSTKRLVGMVNLPERERKTLLRNHRPECVRLAKGVLIRDQRPMPPTALSRALDEDLMPSDWYEFLNGFVFFWPDQKRLERQRRACGDRPQILLTFDSAALFGHFGASAFVSPINSGNARRKALGVASPRFFPTKLGLSSAGPLGVGHALLLRFCSNASSRRYRPI